MHIWGPLRSSMTKVTLLNRTDRCLSDWLNLFDWATGCLRLHKSFKGRRFCKCEKRGRRKKRKNIPLQPFFCNRHAHIHTAVQLLEGLFMSFKHLIHCPTTQAFFRSSASDKDCKLGKSVICQRHWLGAELWADAASRWGVIKGRVEKYLPPHNNTAAAIFL